MPLKGNVNKRKNNDDVIYGGNIMKQKLLIAAAATALMAVPSLASAQDSGWYLRGNAGYGIHNDIDIENGVIIGDGLNTGATGITGDVESEGNVTGSVGLGYEFGNNWRLEADVAQLFSDLGAIGQQPSSSAKLRTTSAMLNAIYDFNDFGRFKPFVGAGVGLVRSDADIVAHDFFDPSGTALIRNPACSGPITPNQGRTCNVNDRDTGLGWQLLAGLGYAITDNLTWDTQYRYLDAGSPTFSGTTTNAVNGVVLPINVELEDAAAHSLLTGFRYRFGGSTPPPPPPPPAPVADYECWDGSKVFNAGQCPARPVEPTPEVRCWDGTIVSDQAQCPAQPETFTCWDGTLVYDLATCPVQTRTGESVAKLCSNQYRQEIIYYEFDKGQSAETRNTINRILDVGEFCNVDNIRVVGHTDTSGSAAYNLALSKRRAADAREELVRQGINQAIITSEGKGETEPFVDTGDGVKEQLNRRTEVLISLSELNTFN